MLPPARDYWKDWYVCLLITLSYTPGTDSYRHGSQTTSNPRPTPAKNRRHLNIHLYTVTLRTTPLSNMKDVKAGKNGRSRARDSPFPLLCTVTTAIDWALPLAFGFCEYVWRRYQTFFFAPWCVCFQDSLEINICYSSLPARGCAVNRCLYHMLVIVGSL